MKVYRWTDGKTDGQTRQTDRQRDGRREKSDQTSSLEFLTHRS